jgi:hypothetical protein
MPYCGRCLNVGRAGKRGAPPEYGPAFNLDSGVLLGQAPPTPNRASMRLREAGAPGHPIEGIVGRGQWGEISRAAVPPR